jgi:hypothetical protein
MKHRSTRELFEYWNAKRGRRLAPDREDIEPEAIRHILADTFIVAFDSGRGHPFRIAGTRVCALFGRELKGQAFLRLWTAECRSLVHDLVIATAQESVGVVAGATGVSTDGYTLDLEFLALPLYQRGRVGGRVLGLLAPTKVPDWLGTNALGALALGTLRYVGPAVRPSLVPNAAPSLSANGRIRHGFVVLDGGQSAPNPAFPTSG